MSGGEGFDERSVSELLDSGLADMGLALSAERRQRLVGYLRLLQRWNRVYNLSAVRSPVEMVARHLHDSLSVLPHVRGSELIDVGSGAGLPGVVLAIARSDLRCVLLDSAAKRIRFLVQCVAELGLENAEPVRARIESYRAERSFPTVVSRATLTLVDLWRVSQRLLGPDGRVLGMKAAPPEERELAALRRAGARCRVVPCRVPGLPGPRHVAVMEPGSVGAPGPSRI